MSDHNTSRVAGPFRREEFVAFVADWYHQLDVHAPADHLVALVDEYDAPRSLTLHRFVAADIVESPARDLPDFVAGAGELAAA